MAGAGRAGLEPQFLWPGSPGLYKPVGKVGRYGGSSEGRGVRSSLVIVGGMVANDTSLDL